LQSAQCSPHLRPKAKVVGPAESNATTQFNVFMPLTNQAALEKLLTDQTTPGSSDYHHWLTPAQFKAKFGPNSANVEKVKSALEAAGLKVTGETTQTLKVQGPVWAVEKAFGTTLQQVETAPGHTKLAAANGKVTLPETLAAAGAMVPAFSKQLAHVHSERTARNLLAAKPDLRLAASEALYYPNDMNEAYQLPSFRTEIDPLFSHKPAQIAGVGSHIGIVISSVISPADLGDTFNSSIYLGGTDYLTQAYTKYSNLPEPKVTVKSVDGGSGPFDANSDDAAEASLDTQMSLGTAPGAKEILYNIPDLSDEEILSGYDTLVEDNVVDVVSSSFGECELYYTAAYNGGDDQTFILGIYHQIFQQGNAQGITFLASSGDNGAVPCLSAGFVNNPTNGTSFVPGVESPASDPNVTAVGGTNLQTKATPGEDDATYLSENANFDPEYPAEYEIGPSDIVSVNNATWGSGGGYSTVYPRPAYQKLVNTGNSTHRAVPDVALMMGGCPGGADLSVQDCTMLPRSAAIVWIGGEADLLIGTSSSSPQMAGVLALAVEAAGTRLGNVNPLIYSLSALQTLAGGVNAPKPLQFFHRDITGDNNYYKVKPGQAYSEVLGNSTLDVKNFLGLSFVPAAGTPDTKTNP
jgi:subtilase family serine protease